MSPLSRYVVTLTVGRKLTLTLEARDPQEADEIADYLSKWCGPPTFEVEPEDVFYYLFNVSVPIRITLNSIQRHCP